MDTIGQDCFEQSVFPWKDMVFSGNTCRSLTSDLCSHNFNGTTWCDRALLSPSRSTAWTCGGRPTTRQSVPSGMQEAASGWQFSETVFHPERCQTLTDPRTSGTWQGNGRQTRQARRPKQHWWRAQRVVCPRALRRSSAMAMTLWVICRNTTVVYDRRFTGHHARFSHIVFLLFVSQAERTNEPNQVLSKLKKESLQAGKHTMAVGNLLSDRNKKRLHTLLHDFLVFPPWSPILLIQLCDRSRGLSSLIPLPQMKMWSSWHRAPAQSSITTLTFLTGVSTLTTLSTLPDLDQARHADWIHADFSSFSTAFFNTMFCQINLK